ncbi:hypothetical protein GQ44DRAFT_721501 [Phaeosphaeriaceae sp. PMI808]|nr:hypothetical protein GQ44DRAFT_721501 [Phaeosphaeriaceae sp. PMI808]
MPKWFKNILVTSNRSQLSHTSNTPTQPGFGASSPYSVESQQRIPQASKGHDQSQPNSLYRNVHSGNERHQAPANETSRAPLGNQGVDFQVRPEMIRDLRKRIQLRYSLDMQIWNDGRKKKSFARKTVQSQMQRSDAVLKEIKIMLQDWDYPEYFEDEASYNTFCVIKQKIEAGGKREWARDPPWAKVAD